MATGQSETLKQFQELAEAVLRVTERLERLMEHQERQVERADVCADRFDRLSGRADGLQHSRDRALDEAYRRLVGKVENLEKRVRLMMQAVSWNAVFWSFIGAFFAVVVHDIASRSVGWLLELGRNLLR
jgi:predicted nuclease with TOPRIM domain